MEQLFGNEFGRNVVIFGVDNSSSFNTDNDKSNFLGLDERPTNDVYGNAGVAERKFSINFSKAKTKFCLRLYSNVDNSFLYVNGKEIYKLKVDNKNVNFPTKFCLGSIPKKI